MHIQYIQRERYLRINVYVEKSEKYTHREKEKLSVEATSSLVKLDNTNITINITIHSRLFINIYLHKQKYTQSVYKIYSYVHTFI